VAKLTVVVAVLFVCAGPALQQSPPRDPVRQAAPAPKSPESEAALVAKLAASPGDKDAARALFVLYNQQGDVDKAMLVLQASAAANPSDPQGHQLVAVYYWEMASKGDSLPLTQQLAYISDGIAALDRALELKPEYVDALTYKNILLRMRANRETDPAQKQQSNAEAAALRNRAIELTKQRALINGSDAPTAVNPPPPPPPPAPGAAGYPPPQAPVRVGGNIMPPTKTRDVRPVYPPEAQEARIQGIVIIEATLDTSGRVSDAKVLRSIPILDQAAIDAVMQWEFTPTMLNGAPVPVIMTVTVNFTLM